MAVHSISVFYFSFFRFVYYRDSVNYDNGVAQVKSICVCIKHILLVTLVLLPTSFAKLWIDVLLQKISTFTAINCAIFVLILI